MSTPPLLPAHLDYPIGTVVRIDATTGTSFGVKDSDGRWRRMVAADGFGASDEHTLPHAVVVFVPGGGR